MLCNDQLFLFTSLPLDIDTPHIFTSASEVRERNNLTLTCTVQALPSIPTQQWAWKHNGVLISNGSSLLLSNLAPVHSGMYECVAHNYVGIKANSTLVDVICEFSSLMGYTFFIAVVTRIYIS